MRKSLRSADYDRLVALLVATRKRADVRQRELAEALEKPQSFVSKYEGGERRIDLIEFIEIARALGAEPERLFRKFLRDQVSK